MEEKKKKNNKKIIIALSVIIAICVIIIIILLVKNRLDYNPIKIDPNAEELKDDDTKLNFVPSYDKTKYTYNITVPDTYVVGENLVKITLKDKDGNESEYSIIVFKKEVVKENPVSEDKCKCVDTPCSYKKYFLIENIILIIALVTLFIFSILKKNKTRNN